MSPRPNPSAECARAREWASLHLDSRLSDFESALLDAHLAHCDDCRVFAGTAAWATEALRTAPLEVPTTAFAYPLRRRSRFRGLGAGSIAAVGAVAALIAAVNLQLSSGGRPTATAHVDPGVLTLKQRQMDQLDAGGASRAVDSRPGVLALKQRQMDQLDAGGASRAVAIRPGLSAARQTTITAVAVSPQPAGTFLQNLSNRT
jgi:hypothetical protein